MLVVVVDLQQERVGDVHLERVDVGQDRVDLLVRILQERQPDEVLRVPVDVGDDLLHRRLLPALQVGLEAGVDLVDVRDSARLDRQVVPHEAVELDRILGVAEALLHRIPVTCGRPRPGPCCPGP